MNKQDRIIVIVLGVLLLGWIYYQNRASTAAAAAAAERARQAPAAVTSDRPAVADEVVLTAAPAAAVTNIPAGVATNQVEAVEAASDEEEVLRVLSSEEMEVTVSSKGGTVRAATLRGYRASVDRASPPVVLDFDPQPALALEGIPGFGRGSDFVFDPPAATNSVTLRRRGADGLELERLITLQPQHRIEVVDRWHNAGDRAVSWSTNHVALGAMHRGDSPNDVLAADSLDVGRDSRGRKPKVHHWEGDLPVLFTGRKQGFGCGGKPSAEGLPVTAARATDIPQQWVALKNRFFVHTFASSATNAGFRIEAARDSRSRSLLLAHVKASVAFDGLTVPAGGVTERSYTVYMGPKKLSTLRKLDTRAAEIMQFGTFKWMCGPLVYVLNAFHAMVPNYGVAVILLTLLVRVIFWPLTHKSTESMKRMQALQPQLKEIQAKFKDEPQKLQQETWKLYRENKANPMASCLPMIVQIPVFIALFTVLRSAVELRFAPFLWVQDLSEPENLLQGVLPLIPALNILPLLMAATMVLQSRLTPSMGDPAQQKMMMWMMPGMMLFMFYSMPSGLVLYWTVSQGVSIVQLWWQRRNAGGPAGGGSTGGPDAAAEATTRQMRRRMSR